MLGVGKAHVFLWRPTNRPPMEQKRVVLAKMLVLLVILTVISWLLLQWPAFTNADTDLFLYVNTFYDVTLANALYIVTFLG